MPETAKTPHTELRVWVKGKKKTERIIAFLREQGAMAEVIEPGDDELIIATESAWYKDVKERATPGEVLRAMREVAGLTQEALAERVGVRRENISALERGKRPFGRAMAEKLATTLHCPAARFQGRW
ncbi:MAG: helix-turn-helix domain-containing protein [Desulfobulbaceae bacterium]|jgi:DNA-binding XRE family transcriptional regulator|nr:helix-turn-helix domain-containing protein [Desulfobulbaceae bacterium]